MSLRRFRGWASVGLLVCLASVGQAKEPAPSDPASSLPPDTLIYLAADGKSYAESFPKTSLGRLMADPRMERIKQAFQQFTEMAQANSGEPALELLTRLTRHVEKNPVMFAVLSIGLGQPPTTPGQPGVPPFVDAVMRLDGREAGANLIDEIGQLLDRAELPEATPTQIAGHEFAGRVVPGAPIALYYGQVGDSAYVATSPKAIEKVLTPGAASLARAPAFVEGRARTGGARGLTELYVDVPALRSLALDALGQFGPPDLPPIAAILAAAGLDRVGALFASARIQDDGFASALWLACPRVGEGVALLDAAVLARVPARSRFFTAGRCDLDALRQWLLQVVRVALPPPAHEQIEQQIAAVEQDLGFTLAAFLGSLGTEYLVFEDAEMPGLLPSFVLELRPANPDQLRECVNQLGALAGGLAADAGAGVEVQIRDVEIAGRQARYLSLTGAAVPVTPAWVQDGDRLVVTLHLAHLEDLLLRRQQGQAKSILDNPDFVRGRRQLPASFHGLSYMDSGQVLSWLYATLLPMLQAGLQGFPMPFDVDVSVLPAPRVIASHLFGDVESWTRDADGYHWVSHTSTSAPTGAMMAGAGVGFLAGLTIPALTTAKGKAEEAQAATEVRELGMLLRLWAQDHRDDFPDDLRDLYSWDSELEASFGDHDSLVERIVYLGQGKRANGSGDVVILHSRTPLPNGKAAVVYADGAVEVIFWHELQARLEEQR
ncbi:MAG: hypothetical protein AB7O52_12225 [Planctomycetota bacterium]